MISLGKFLSWAMFHNNSRTLLAMRPSLSSSANRRINSSSFSRCFLLAFVQLSWRNERNDDRKVKVRSRLILLENNRTNVPTVQERSPRLILPKDREHFSRWLRVFRKTNSKFYRDPFGSTLVLWWWNEEFSLIFQRIAADANNRVKQCLKLDFHWSIAEKKSVEEKNSFLWTFERTINLGAVKLSGSSERLIAERWIVFKLIINLFTSFKAFILPLNEFVCKSLKFEWRKNDEFSIRFCFRRILPENHF